MLCHQNCLIAVQKNIGYNWEQSIEQVKCLDPGLNLDPDLDPGLCQACNKREQATVSQEHHDGKMKRSRLVPQCFFTICECCRALHSQVALGWLLNADKNAVLASSMNKELKFLQLSCFQI